jgi:predicted small lipoprotein YifL
MRRSILLLPFCLVAATLAGCGQKGPLVLPPTRPIAAPVPVLPAAAASAATPAHGQR